MFSTPGYGNTREIIPAGAITLLASGCGLANVSGVKNLFLALSVIIGFIAANSARAELDWLTDYKKAQEEAKANNKSLLINFTGSDWCPACVELQKEVFSTPQFRDYASKNFVFLEIDFPRSKPQPQEVALQNQELAARYGIEAFPSVIVVSSEGKKIGELIGYNPDVTVEMYIAELEKFRKS